MTMPWPKVPLKYLVSKIGSGKTPKGGAEVYTSSGVMLLRSQNVHFDGLRLDDVVYIDDEMDRDMASTRVQPNDVLLNITGASIGRCTVVPEVFGAANVNQHVCIIRPEVARLLPHYLNLVLQSPTIQDEIWFGENGSSREGLNFEQVGAFEIPVPPLAVQQTIASRARTDVFSVERLIEEKQQLIDLLAEKRRSLIAHAVTRGLDPVATLRESGIEWLGQIPAHWRLLPLRRLIRALDQGWSPVASNLPAADGECGVLKLSAIKNGVFLPEENKALLPSDDIPPGLDIQAGDVFLTRANTPSLVGDAAMADKDHPNLVFSDLIYRLRPNPDLIDPRWLVLTLISDLGRRQIEAEAKGSSGSMVKLAQDQVLGISISVPPIAEQVEILQRLTDATQGIQRLSEVAKETILLLEERRSALIAESIRS
ncbi:MAG: restriction endonuclease subunit S [Burkholderiales bacterium]